jgi:N-acetylglucosamine-6-phosphate deacetylase
MAAAVRNAVSAGAAVETAVAAASTRPAALLGADLATLRPGDRADVVVLDDDLHAADTLVSVGRSPQND